MSLIRQSDITNNSISFTRYSSVSFTTTAVEAQGNITATAYAVGLSTGMTASQPLFVKESGVSITGWADEQDWTAYGIALTTTIPFMGIAGGLVVATTGLGSLVTGDLVGIYGAGSWSLGTSLLTARSNAATVGSINSALVAAGATNSATNIVESYNGSAWVTNTPINTARSSLGGAGTAFAAIIAGGITSGASAQSAITELFNGASWNTGNNLNQIRQSISMFGSQQATLAAGGSTGGSNSLSTSELFNGTIWFQGNNLVSILQNSAGAGTQNAGLVAGGSSGVSGVTNQTELFNGSTWSYSGVLTEVKSSASAMGTQNAGLISGGTSGATKRATAELFNGSSWYLSSPLSAAKNSLSGAGSQNACIVAGGITNTLSIADTERHVQTLYRKVIPNQYRDVKNFGLISDIVSSVANVKFSGYMNNMAVTAANAAVTTAANWVNTYLVLSRHSPNINTTNNPSSVVSKTNIEADDLIIGFTYSQTQSYVFGNNLFGFNTTTVW